MFAAGSYASTVDSSDDEAAPPSANTVGWPFTVSVAAPSANRAVGIGAFDDHPVMRTGMGAPLYPVSVPS